ncbi:MAG TPA: cyclase family protein [Gemmatimonadaceae bacterium]|nr:cyclase family protein [Gemmatimonadaceae bacterium]
MTDAERRHRAVGEPIDVSMLVRPGTPEWPGDTPFSCRWTWDMAQGATVQVSAIETSPHVGTHADAPLHVRPGGAGIDELPLDLFAGPALVLTVDGAPRDVEPAELLARVPAGTERLLLRTGRTIAGGAFPDDWPALTPACVEALVARGLRLLGTDAPSVDRRESKTLDTHQALFAAGAGILENLDLRPAPDGAYHLAAYPVRWEGLDAAPVRAVLSAL